MNRVPEESHLSLSGSTMKDPLQTVSSAELITIVAARESGEAVGAARIEDPPRPGTGCDAVQHGEASTELNW